MTLALTNRLIDAETGVERLNLTVGQRYYFGKQRVTLPGETPRDTLATDLVTAFTGQVTPEVRVDGTWDYNTDQSKTLTAEPERHVQARSRAFVEYGLPLRR